MDQQEPIKKKDKQKVVHLQLRLPEKLHEQVRQLSFDSRRSQNDILLEALSQYMEERSC